MADRKTSPLAEEEDAAPWQDKPPSEPASRGSDQRKQQQTSTPEPRESGGSRFPSTSRRKRSGKALDPFDKVSTNFNLPLVIRRLSRMLAARRECDVQDVVTEALLEKFEREGIEVPTTRAEYDQMQRDGKL